MAAEAHPAAIDHLPFFITGPGETDVLFYVMVAFLVVVVLVVGNLYFQLHAFPERMAHRTSKIQMEIVAVLCLIALFTHNHLFWIGALLLAMVELPDFTSPLVSIARSLRKLSGRPDTDDDPPAPAPHPHAAVLPASGTDTPVIAKGEH